MKRNKKDKRKNKAAAVSAPPAVAAEKTQCAVELAAETAKEAVLGLRKSDAEAAASNQNPAPDQAVAGSGLSFHHGRSLPLPLRVKTGSFSDGFLIAETAKEKYKIAWDKIKLVCLGFVSEKYDTEAAAYVTEKMINDMGRMVKGGDSSEGRIVSFKESHVLDVCVEDLPEPLRFESGIINYRAFLGRVSFVSFQNFFKFVHEFVSHCRQARFNDNVKHFLAWQRHELHRCAAFHEHNEEVAVSLGKLDSLLRFADLDLSRTSWAQEWSD
ncbi:MAG: hypothetical protein Q4F00_07400 [bacterium]|nr:hypothetical protein [bacterium]